MPFEKCPECGETNFEEDLDGERTFDCNFQSGDDRRVSRCENPERRSPESPGEISRHRLALFDCSQILDGIGNDMRAKGVSPEHAGQCSELASVMRQFAQLGQDVSAPDDDTPPAGKVLSIFRKPWSK